MQNVESALSGRRFHLVETMRWSDRRPNLPIMSGWQLKDSPHLKHIADFRRRSAKVTTYLQPLHAHGLIAKIPHSRRWRLTRQGRIAMTAAIQLRDVQFAITYVKLTA